MDDGRWKARTRRALRAPFLHFLLLGGLVYVAWPILQPRAPIDETRVIQVPADLPRNRVETWVEEEILYREGLRRGLHQNPSTFARLGQIAEFVGGDDLDPALAAQLGERDPLIRALVAEKMRLVLQQSADEEPSDRELESYLDTHESSFQEPARYRLTQVFFSRARRGGRASQDAADFLAGLRRQGSGALREAERLGDFFPFSGLSASWSERELRTRFGEDFASAVASAPEDSWIGPVPSSYGRHLVWIAERLPARIPGLEEVRSRLREAWRHERAEKRYELRMAQLRELYEIRGLRVRTSDSAPPSQASG